MEIDVSIPPGPGPRRSVLTRALDRLHDLTRWHWFAIGAVIAVGAASGLIMLTAPDGAGQDATPSAARAEPSPDPERDKPATPSPSPEPSRDAAGSSGTQHAESSATQAKKPKPEPSPSSTPTRRAEPPKETAEPTESPESGWPSEEDLERLREYYEEHQNNR
ncbi:hypothetical protein CLV63_105292 [Murinocardiopsis flavida]|uniref:Uncharacterized protein n=1 Tax=Murinocardiopsis flavida TaxID=645275 RepID=A0A2P8DN20_9ACTN|nr:hypothetical protein [Murinocardiopsis flavida]PSK98618.1 hypothetical protein CLV63_105292 [Murinocardiopsis flavida]